LAKSRPCLNGGPALYSGPCAVGSVNLQGVDNAFSCDLFTSVDV